MPFFVLLLTPKVKKFELIHFQKTPEYVTVQVLLHQIIQLTQNVEFQEQQHIGFYCPKTKQQLLLGNIDCKEDASVATGSTDKESTDNYDPTKSIEETTSTNVTGDGNPCPTTLSSSSNKETTDSYQIPTEISTTASSPSNNTVTMDPVLDLESLGQILVAIPKDYKMSRIIKQANKILDSPAFRLLTANSLEQAENTTVAQELEQLKQQSLTTNVSQFLNEQVTYNQQATALHQEQQLDLEKRRISPKATAPDTHGLSPLDAMRVAQNQQKAAARQQERMTLQQYQRHLDTLVVDTTPSTTTNTTTTTTTTSALSTPDLKDLVTPASERTFPDFVSPNTDDGGNTTITTTPSNPPTNESNGMFVSSSLARRQSLEQQKQAELEAIRKQGLTQTIKNAAYFDPQESTATSKQMALQEQTKAELASLSNLSVSQHHKSWREMASSSTSSPTISPQVQSNRSLKQLFMTTTIPSSSNNNSNNTNETIKPELEELRRQGLTKAVSLHQVPALEKKHSSLSSSHSELEQLKTLGLTKSLKSQFVDTVKANEEQTLAYQAQVKDLQERKAKTKTFEASRNELSAADSVQLNLAKQKREDELKKREAMGYYQSYKDGGGGAVAGDNKDWKTTGKVLTTVGQGPTVVKEWEAMEEENLKSRVPQAPTKVATGNSPSTEDGETKQGCACIIL